MYKKMLVLLFIIISIFFVCPKANAKVVYNNNFSNNIYILEDENILEDYNEYANENNNNEMECTGGNSLLGDPDDPNSVAWLLQHFLDYIKIIGPVLVIILSSIDFASVIVKGDDDAMAKAKKKLTTRLILAGCLFFIPVFVTLLLDLFGITGNATCGLK